MALSVTPMFQQAIRWMRNFQSWWKITQICSTKEFPSQITRWQSDSSRKLYSTPYYIQKLKWTCVKYSQCLSTVTVGDWMKKEIE